LTSAPELSLHDFNKTVHGYAGVYASQSEICLTDMSATMVCFRKPEKLFETLEENLGYKILRKYEGVYYIYTEGLPAEKTLAVQIVVSSEIPREDYGILLKVLGPGIDKADAEQVIALPEEVKAKLAFWWDVVYLDNPELFLNHFNKEGSMITWKEFFDRADEKGMLKENMQKYVQEGRQETLALIEKGYSVEEIKRKLQLA
jgi:hypothetical protein